MNVKWMAGVCLVGALGVAGCDREGAGSPDVTENIEKSLDQANLDDVTVDQDRDKGIIRLGGDVASDSEKAHAESIAKAAAPRDTIANEIRVLPAGMERRANDVLDDLDAGIENNLDAAFTKADIDGVTHRVETQVVTLTGSVASAAERTRIEKLAAAVPNVKQVVNEIEIDADRSNNRTNDRPADRSTDRPAAPAR
jgi:osmotically-inducible protein OsmY